MKTTRYGQKALAFAVTHPIPHAQVSTEIHRTGGPFTLVPLPDYEGRPSSAVVWMEDGPEAKRLLDMDIPAFEAEMTARSCHLFGPLTLASKRSIWPIISQVAEAAPDDLGSRTMLDAYHRARHLEIKSRVAGIDLLNRASRVHSQPLRDARAMGLNAIYSLAPVRKTLMQMGLGLRD